MLDQKNPAGAVNDHGTGAQRRRTRETPIKVHNPADDRLERSAQTIQAHGLLSRARSF
jgi:hypothetical protein